MAPLSRRDLLLKSGGASSLLFAPKLSTAFGQEEAAPHFHINLYFYGSIDSSYMFDARPMSHTAAGKIQNYNESEPEMWMGQNQQAALIPSYMNILKPFKDEITILNGVHMAVGSDSHDENLRFLISGATAENSLYLASINRAKSPLPLDALNTGLISFFTNGVSDMNSFVSLSAPTAAELKKTLADSAKNPKSKTYQSFIDGRVEELARKSGLLSKGAKGIFDAIPGKNVLKERIVKTEVSLEPSDDFSRNLQMIGQYFKHNIARSAFIADGESQNDTHDVQSAKKQPENYSSIAKKIHQVIQFLKDTPYDEKLGVSLFDVTTLSIGSEFNRTNRQLGNSISNTGTDHNSLSNMLIFTGKGIRGGQVFGATDLDQIDSQGNYSQVSEVHKSFDPVLIKRMGKPFEFETGRVVDEFPTTYTAEHYLTIATVINTIYTLFGVSNEKFISNNRNEVKAPILSQLLK